MFLKSVVVGALATNCYIIADNEEKLAAIIDPGSDAQKILSVIEKHGFKVPWIILTHGHMDHIGAVKDIKDATGAKIAIHEKDQDMLTSPEKNLSGLMMENISAPPADVLLRDGQSITLGGLNLDILHTPGHTPGGISIKVGDVLFTGDTLFQGSIGRTDFPKGCHKDLITSIQEKLIPLGDQMVVYPGHGPKTTIKWEKSNNPFLN